MCNAMIDSDWQFHGCV